MFTFLFIYLHIYLGLSGFKSTPSTSISIYRYLSIDTHLSISIYRYLSIDINLSISIYPSIQIQSYVESIHLHRSIYPSLDPIMRPPTHQSIHQSVYTTYKQYTTHDIGTRGRSRTAPAASVTYMCISMMSKHNSHAPGADRGRRRRRRCGTQCPRRCGR